MYRPTQTTADPPIPPMKTYVCSNCKYRAWGDTGETLYCPNCGVRMRSNEEMTKPGEIIVSQKNVPFHEERKWIPVSERLPEEDVPVLVAVKQKDRLPKWVEKQTYHYVTDIDVWDADGGWCGNKRNVTAWMPLPEPYRESEE